MAQHRRQDSRRGEIESKLKPETSEDPRSRDFAQRPPPEALTSHSSCATVTASQPALALSVTQQYSN
jgi:hypothetical protein